MWVSEYEGKVFAFEIIILISYKTLDDENSSGIFSSNNISMQ